MKKIRITLFGRIPSLKPSKRSLTSHTIFSTAQIMAVLPDSHRWYVEPKRDGIRATLRKDGGKVILVSEEEKRMNPERLGIIIAEARKVFPGQCIIDGELLLLGAEGKASQGHEKIAGYVHKHGPPRKEEANQLRYFYWDLLYLNGKDLTSEPLVRRKSLLKFRDSPHIKENPYGEVAKDLKQLRAAIKTHASPEGAMIKATDSTYWQDNLIFKEKHFYDLDVKVVKVTQRINGQTATCSDREGNIVGETYKQTHTKMQKGDIIRVMITKIYRHIDKKTGKETYRWYSPIVKTPADLASGLKVQDHILKRHPKAVDSQATLKKMWEITGGGQK